MIQQTFACDRCGFDQFTDEPIHGGISARRDCARCGLTAGFPLWCGVQIELDTRVEAAKAIAPHAGKLQRQVLDFIRQRGQLGATDEEITDGLHMNDSTARARRVELRDSGFVRESGRFRKTASGCKARVWVATVEGIA